MSTSTSLSVQCYGDPIDTLDVLVGLLAQDRALAPTTRDAVEAGLDTLAVHLDTVVLDPSTNWTQRQWQYLKRVPRDRSALAGEWPHDADVDQVTITWVGKRVQVIVRSSSQLPHAKRDVILEASCPLDHRYNGEAELRELAVRLYVESGSNLAVPLLSAQAALWEASTGDQVTLRPFSASLWVDGRQVKVEVAPM